MFRRDFNHPFKQSEDGEDRDRSRGFNNPKHNTPAFNGPLPPFPPPPPGRPLPVNRKAFHEIRNFIILTIISENPNGITGYHLQERYNFPRGTLLRSLQDFEDKRFVEVHEEIIQGRLNKFYTINERGKKYLEKLKRKWANLFAMMSEKANPEQCEHPFAREWFRLMMIENIDSLTTKTEGERFFNKIKDGINVMIDRFSSRIEKLEQFRKEIDLILTNIQQMEEFDRRKLKDDLDDSFRKINEKNRKIQ